MLDADFSGSIQSYRCFRFPWQAQPTTAPASSVDPPAGGMVTAYASWNGATEVASWEVLGGSQAARDDLAGNISPGRLRDAMTVKPAGALLAVRALDANRAVLGRIATVTIPE